MNYDHDDQFGSHDDHILRSMMIVLTILMMIPWLFPEIIVASVSISCLGIYPLTENDSSPETS